MLLQHFATHEGPLAMIPRSRRFSCRLGSTLLPLLLATGSIAAVRADIEVTLSIDPPEPVAGRSATLELAGVWPHDCVPYVRGVLVSPGLVLLQLDFLPLGRPCSNVETPVQLSVPVEGLTPGLWTARASIVDPGNDFAETQVVAVLAFEVQPAEGDVLLTLDPFSPTDVDPLQILVSGEWEDRCVPRYAGTTARGAAFEILAVVEGDSCPAGATPWAFAVPLGPPPLGGLDAGSYSVDLRLADRRLDPNAQGEVVATTTLTVAEGSDWALLLDDARARRYRVLVQLDSGEGERSARPAPARSPDTAIFWFFDRSNWEVTVKVLDGCALNGHVWVLISAATDVDHLVTVVSLETLETRVYPHPGGAAAPAVIDTQAFPCEL